MIYYLIPAYKIHVFSYFNIFEIEMCLELIGALIWCFFTFGKGVS